MRRMDKAFTMRDGCRLPRDWEAAVLKIVDEIESKRQHGATSRFEVYVAQSIVFTCLSVTFSTDY